MDKYDYKILLARVINELASQGEVSETLLKEVGEAYEKDKGKVDSVFGVSTWPDYEGDENTLYIFVSDRKTWIDEGHCADYYPDDTGNIFNEIGLTEHEDAIWSQPYPPSESDLSRAQLIIKLKCLGFIYDKKFEEFMMDV